MSDQGQTNDANVFELDLDQFEGSNETNVRKVFEKISIIILKLN